MKANEVLNHHHLKRTSCREGIIDVVMSSDEALSEAEIRDRLQGCYDRTTFYRSFKTLEENKIIHKIIVDNNLVKYAFDSSALSSLGHAHFHCVECNSVRCLNTVALEKASLPQDYEYAQAEILIRGTCNKCKKQHSKP